MPKRPLTDSFSVRLAKARRNFEKRPIARLLGGRGAATLVLGAALSVGGLTQTLDGVHFLVQKDLDSVKVVRQRGETEKVMASIDHGFTGNTVFKLSQALPERYVTRELSLFDSAWLPSGELLEPAKDKKGKSDVFYTEMRRINDSLRREFFETKIPYGDLIYEKSQKYKVDPILVAAVIEQESRFRKRAISPVGARGLMQLMPRTGRWMGARDLYDPEQNIDAGVKYIKYLNKRFDGNIKLTIAAYNGGEGNVKRYGGVPPFRETRQYVKKVMNNHDKRTKQLQKYETEQRKATGGSIPEVDGTLTLR
ncbi:MAG TPA: lytic transglycosylase domain-containing protein [Thermoanaerobaculia bacterium]